MNSIVQETTKALKGKKTLEAIASQTGSDTEKASEVIDSLVPRLFEGFSDKATKPGGSAVVTEVLEEQEVEILDDLPAYFEKGDNKAGARIMRKVLPGKTTELVDSFASETGLSKSSFKRLIPMIMPVVASVTAKQVDSNKITGEDLGSFLVDQETEGEKPAKKKKKEAEDSYEAVTPAAARRPFFDDEDEEESDPSWLWWVIAGLISLAAVALILGELTSDDDENLAEGETEEVVEPVEEGVEEESTIDPDLTQAAADAIDGLELEDASIEVVATSNGLAAVAGVVSSQEEADSVVEAISGVDGIESVFNELMVVEGGASGSAEPAGPETETEELEEAEPEETEETETEEAGPVAPSTVDEGSLNAALNIGPFQFEENSSVLTAASQDSLTSEVLPFLLENTEQGFVVEGHTNNIGQARDDGERNRELSLLRAGVVRDFLIDAADGEGSLEDRLDVEGFGPDQPLVPHEDADAATLNRRVVLVPAG